MAYLTSLGHPGPIDASLDAHQCGHFPCHLPIARRVAILSETLGELSMAADLYARISPRGALGPHTYLPDQVSGLVRVKEREGRCRAVVAHRLLDVWSEYHEDDDGSGVGPGSLVRAGWDLPRMYRGALLTRNRGDEKALRRALRGDEAALVRLRREGPEHWEWWVRAVEGLADVGGPGGVDDLVALLPVADDELRARTLRALGDAAHRGQVDPCEPSEGGPLQLDSMETGWQRSVRSFGQDCRTRLSDAEAAALVGHIVPYSSNDVPDVGNQALIAIGKLAVPDHEALLERWQERAQRLEDTACADGMSEACTAANNRREAADLAYAELSVANGRVVPDHWWW